jgi:steroid 5-alpha reductase family enzyme
MNHNIKEYSISLICILIAFLVSIAAAQNGALYNNYPISIICMALSFIIHWLVFIPSFFYKTEKFYDITGTVAYMSILITTAYLLSIIKNEVVLLRSILSIIFVMIWAIRLGAFLFTRVIKVGEDKRFEDAKKSFSKFLMFFNISALWVFLTVVNVLTMIINNSDSITDIFFIIGFSIAIIGLIIEVVADRQKRKFRMNISNKGEFIRSGLWSISRHPNYFGEILIWLGISFSTLPILSGWQFITLISPIFVILLLTKVSGINLLETAADEKWALDKNYQDYKEKTSVLIPFLTYKR